MTKFVVDKNKCMGCGYCFSNLPDVFYQDDDGLAAAKEEISEDLVEEANDTKDSCPVGAISVEEDNNSNAA